MFTHLAWVSPVNLTLGRVIHQVLAFLGMRLLEAQHNTACMSCLAGQRAAMGKGQCKDQKTCDRSSVWFRTEDETQKSHISVNLKHSRKQNQTNSHQCFKSLNFAVCQWISRAVEAAQKEILTLGKLRRCSLQMSINPGCKQHTSNKNFTDHLLMTLNANLQPWPLSKAPDVYIQQATPQLHLHD